MHTPPLPGTRRRRLHWGKRRINQERQELLGLQHIEEDQRDDHKQAEDHGMNNQGNQKGCDIDHSTSPVVLFHGVEHRHLPADFCAPNTTFEI
jgi:hypothetical protein